MLEELTDMLTIVEAETPWHRGSGVKVVLNNRVMSRRSFLYCLPNMNVLTTELYGPPVLMTT